MAKLHPAGAIQLSDDLAFTKKSWIVERAGWGFLTAFLAAALLGLLGPGLFSRRTAVSGRMAVEYHRFGHFKTDETFTVQMTASPDEPGLVSFWIDRKFLDDVTLKDLQPQPLEVRPEEDRTTFVFPSTQRHSTVAVRVEVVPDKPGRLTGRFGQAKDSGVEVRQFVYP